MSDRSGADWPTAELDPVRRLRVLARAVGSVAIVETEIDAPYERVWSFVTDFEHGTPSFDWMVASAEVREGPHGLQVVASPPVLPLRTVFDVDLSEGFCFMRSRFYLVGMAAVPVGGRTHYAHLEGLPRRGFGALRPMFRRIVTGDVRSITKLVT